MTDPSTTPGADPQIAAFARMHPGWECWKAASGIYHARLRARREVHVRGEDLQDLAIEIRRAEEGQPAPPPPPTPGSQHSRYMAAAQVEDGDLAARLANIRRRLESGEYTPLEGAREQIAVMTEHLAELRRLRVRHLGTTGDRDVRASTVSEIQELLRPTGWNERD